ncbi:MAG: carboxymuconolactone decarboxylase family protein [Pseudomonadota bacterium]
MPQRLPPVPAADRRSLEPLRPAIEATLGGFVPNSLYVMAHNPDLLIGFGALSRGVFRGSPRTRIGGVAALRAAARQIWRAWRLRRDPPLEEGLRALIFLAASLSAGCRYCQAHSVTQAQDRGIGQEKIDDILRFDTSPHFTAAERAALAVAFAANEVPGAVTEAQFAALRAEFTAQQIVDIVAAIAYIAFLNRWNDTFATVLEDRPAGLAAQALAPRGWEIGAHGA